MTELEAVNTVLTYLGDHTITRVEGSRHPTVGLIVAGLKRQRQALLTEKWWFNKLKLYIQPNTDGRVNVPEKTIAVYGISHEVEMRGEYFYCVRTGSMQFPTGLHVELIQDMEYDELPMAVAMYVMYKAAIEVVTADQGVEDQIQILMNLAAENYKQMFREQCRKSGFNARPTVKRQAKYNRNQWSFQ